MQIRVFVLVISHASKTQTHQTISSIFLFHLHNLIDKFINKYIQHESSLKESSTPLSTVLTKIVKSFINKANMNSTRNNCLKFMRISQAILLKRDNHHKTMNFRIEFTKRTHF